MLESHIYIINTTLLVITKQVVDQSSLYSHNNCRNVIICIVRVVIVSVSIQRILEQHHFHSISEMGNKRGIFTTGGLACPSYKLARISLLFSATLTNHISTTTQSTSSSAQPKAASPLQPTAHSVVKKKVFYYPHNFPSTPIIIHTTTHTLPHNIIPIIFQYFLLIFTHSVE